MNPNKERAERAMDIIHKHSDQNYILDAAPGIRLDITDIMADLLHLCDRYGLDHDDIIDKARNSYAGDSEDGPRVKPIIGESNA